MNMRFRLFAGIFLLVGCVTVVNADGEGRVSVTPFEEIEWTVLPDGRAIATLSGNRQTGPHTTFVQFPAGLRTPIHTHSNEYDGTIIRGNARHFEPQFEASTKWLLAPSITCQRALRISASVQPNQNASSRFTNTGHSIELLSSDRFWP